MRPAMRSVQDICKEVSEISDEERGDLIRRIQSFDWTPERKAAIARFIMLLGLAGGTSKKQ